MKKVKIIIYVCVCAIFCNIVVKFFIIGNQSTYIAFLQKKAIAVRSDTSSAFARSEQQISKQYNDIKMIMNEIPNELFYVFEEGLKCVSSFLEYVIRSHTLSSISEY